MMANNDVLQYSTYSVRGARSRRNIVLHKVTVSNRRAPPLESPSRERLYLEFLSAERTHPIDTQDITQAGVPLGFGGVTQWLFYWIQTLGVSLAAYCTTVP